MSITSRSKLASALSFALELGFTIAVPIGGFIFLGFLGDRFLGTRPIFLIAGVIVGMIVAFYGTYRSLIPLMSNKENNKDER